MMLNRLGKRSAGIVLTASLLAAGSSFAQMRELKTRAGHEVGIIVSAYDYNEPSVMKLKATKIGFDYSGVLALSDDWFARAEARYTTGKADYNGSGTMDKRPDWFYEVKGVVGRDYRFDNETLSPYIGLGYRYLFNDLRGVTSTGNPGYRRESTYFTLPIGLMHQTRLNNRGRLLSSIEYSHLLRGQQDSRLTDTGLYAGNIENRQRRGYGLRLSVRYEQDRWSVGPFIDYWRIPASDAVSVLRLPATMESKLEPLNKTTEIGVKAAYRF